MEANPTKRRKLGHSAAETIFEGGRDSILEAAASAGTYRPSTFILETQELLKEESLAYKTAFPGAEDLLYKLKGAVESIEAHEAQPISEVSSKFEKANGISIPYPRPRPDATSPYKLSIAKPAQCNVVGSYVAKTMVRSQGTFGIDMVVEMPKSMFQEKDYRDLRYFQKRAYYLANIAAKVKGMPGVADLHFAHLNDNPLLPILSLTPSNTTPHSDGVEEPQQKNHRPQSSYRVQIIPVAPEGLFPASKLLASSSSIRSSASDDQKSARSPKPFYNSTLKAESAFLTYLKVLRQAEKSCAAFKDACMLGRVWLQQRGLSGSISKGGFGHFEWALLVALLLQTGGRKGAAALSSSLSSIQIFKAVIQFLAATDIRSKPCVLGTTEGELESIRESGPVLYDGSRQLNFAFKMSSWSASLLRQHAAWTHKLLSRGELDQFGPVFIIKADVPLQSFDLVARIRCPGLGDQETSIDRRGPIRDIGDAIFQVLKKALGDRVKLMHIQLPPSSPWPLSDLIPTTASATLSVGILFDPLNMTRQVDHGPAAEDKKQARKFRQFWGEKAELRRFKDGRIVETLIWKNSKPFEICEEIVRYVAKLHLQLDRDDLEFVGGGFASLVPIKDSDSASFSAARLAFEQLERDIRALEDLPLQIRHLAPIAPELRSASTRPPVINSAKAALHPMNVVIYFEASGKWPDNLAAIQRAKIAFLLKIGSSLREATSGVSTQVGLEDAQVDIQNLAFLDVVYEEGASFRLRIHSELEENILERRIKDKTLDKVMRTESAHLLATCKRLYTYLPLHNQAISSFCTRFPALSATIRLAKHWFSCHKLTCHFADEFIELAVLRVFVEPYPWDVPSSATTGFLRTLLFLSRWDWRTEPLVVDSSGDLSAADRADINRRLESWRKMDPNMNHTVLLAAASYETGGTAFTTSSSSSSSGGHPLPSKVVARRMTTLARSACKLVRDQGVVDDGLDPRALFTPSLRDYDVLIHLAPKALRSVLHGDDDKKRSAFKNLDERTGAALRPVPGHPAELLLAQLKSLYDGPLVFFHGGAAATDPLIAAVWNPLLHRRSFRATLPCSFRPAPPHAHGSGGGGGGGGGDDDDDDEDTDLVEVNREGILAEIARLGGDLIEKIEITGEAK